MKCEDYPLTGSRGGLQMKKQRCESFQQNQQYKDEFSQDEIQIIKQHKRTLK